MYYAPMSSFRALRGAIQIDTDSAVEIESATQELVATMLDKNGLVPDDLISVIFTMTPDLHSAFPAAAARALGLGHVPLLCAAELDIEGALPRVIRVLVHAETDLALRDVQHVYLRGAVALRRDIAQ